jgi:hypothetical protein
MVQSNGAENGKRVVEESHEMGASRGNYFLRFQRRQKDVDHVSQGNQRVTGRKLDTSTQYV